MKINWIFGALVSAVFLQTLNAEPASDIFSLSPAGTVSLQGWVGGKLDLCLTNRVMAQDLEIFVAPFRARRETSGWTCEFWGKWFTSAALGNAYKPTPENRVVMDRAVQELIATQTPVGYIGTYDAAHQLGTWDIWGRKYVLLGLLADYDLTGDKRVLVAARGEADFLMQQAPPGKVNLSSLGLPILRGVAPSSVLEPMTLLYRRTGEKKYLDFAQSIVADWSAPTELNPHGLRLVDDALAGVPPVKIGSAKAYEMTSCFEGLCELYRATGDRRYLDAAVKYGESVRRTERMIIGSGSNQELWCDGTRTQTECLEQPIETCVTATWMKFCCQILRLTGDPVWADELEVSLYNSMLAALTPEGNWFSYFSPLQGQRVPSQIQVKETKSSCCVVSGPRGLLLTPRWAVMTAADGLVVNLFAPGSATEKLADGTGVNLIQETDYPVGDKIRITVNPERKISFALRLRIPAWSKATSLSVNGEFVATEPGKYAVLKRDWAQGDLVELKLDMRGRAVPAPSGAPELAMMRGPVVLALDNRLLPPQTDAVRLATDADGFVALPPRGTNAAGFQMVFDVPFDVRPSHFFGHHVIQLPMCDYASAGNAWSDTNLFRVWLPQPLLLSQAFVAGTWKLMYPNAKARPTIPLAEIPGRP